MALMFSSCEDNLIIPQHGVLNYDTYYSDDEEIETAGTCMYLAYHGMEHNYCLTRHMLGDDTFAGGATRGDRTDLEALNEFTFDAENTYLEEVFTTFYEIIYAANVVLGQIDPEFSEVAARTVAEAHVFRALCYFDLTTLWGTPPIVDHELSGSEYDQPNATQEDLWAFIEEDLTTAISSGDLPEKSGVNDSETWRVTKQFAQALLGKAYLWQEKYSEAASMLDNVINSGLYALFTEADYGDLRLVDYKHNCESVFETNRVWDSNNSWHNYTSYYLYINYRMDKMDYPTDTPILNKGYGFAVPKDDLYQAFVSVEGADGYRLNQTMLTYDQLKEKLSISISSGSSVIGEGYFMWKNRVLADQRGGSSSWVYYADIIWMRYAEVLLLAAEAQYRAGNTAKATTYFNQVRSRAQAPTVSSVTLDQIKVEKRLELCLEGVRYQDLLRYDAIGETATGASTLCANNGTTYPVIYSNGSIEYVSCNNAAHGFKTGKHEYLPFPATEVRLNSNITQNPGY